MFDLFLGVLFVLDGPGGRDPAVTVIEKHVIARTNS
jgi:hypothetical protein